MLATWRAKPISWVAITIVRPDVGEFADQGEHLADEFGIQRAGDLVEQQQPRVVGQRAGDRDALLLAAGELVRVGIRLVGQADPGQQLAAAVVGLAPAHAVHHPRRQRDVVAAPSCAGTG